MMTLRERLAQYAGVWLGTYTHLTPEGQLLDQHSSRQETRLDGNTWYERVIFSWPAVDGTPARTQQVDFRAGFSKLGDRMTFDDANFFGQTYVVGADIFVLPYHWKNKPDQRVVETLVCSGPTRKSRVWQSFEADRLVKVTVIDEQLSDEQPEVWY